MLAVFCRPCCFAAKILCSSWIQRKISFSREPLIFTGVVEKLVLVVIFHGLCQKLKRMVKIYKNWSSWKIQHITRFISWYGFIIKIHLVKPLWKTWSKKKKKMILGARLNNLLRKQSWKWIEISKELKFLIFFKCLKNYAQG